MATISAFPQIIGMDAAQAAKAIKELNASYECRVIERDGLTIIENPFANNGSLVNMRVRSGKVIAYSVR